MFIKLFVYQVLPAMALPAPPRRRAGRFNARPIAARLASILLGAVAATAPSHVVAMDADVDAATAVSDCSAEGKLSYVCNLPHPEDLAQIPGTQFLVAGIMVQGKSGRIVAIDSRTRSVAQLYPSAVPAERDSKTFPDCPATLDPETFAPLGIDIRGNSDGTANLYVVNISENIPGGRASIEVFRIYPDPAKPAVWIGCVPLPATASGNGVAALPDGGLIASNFAQRGIPFEGWNKQIMNGEITGNALEWHPSRGWHEIEGSSMSGANGVALSSDDRFAYVADSGRRALLRFDLAHPGKPLKIDLDFAPDNVKRAPNGDILITGFPGTREQIFDCAIKYAKASQLGVAPCLYPYRVVSVDPQMSKVTTIANGDPAPSFGWASVGMIMDKELWLGSWTGTRIAIMPLPLTAPNSANSGTQY